MKQREDYRQWCWQIQKTTQSKQVWSVRYRKTWLRYLDSIGLDRMLSAIQGRSFSNVEYLLLFPGDERQIGLLEELEARVKIEDWEKEKANETVSPVVQSLMSCFTCQPLGEPTDEQILAALSALDGEDHAPADELSGKWKT